jgi:hypothetical protein
MRKQSEINSRFSLMRVLSRCEHKSEFMIAVFCQKYVPTYIKTYLSLLQSPVSYVCVGK